MENVHLVKLWLRNKTRVTGLCAAVLCLTAWSQASSSIGGLSGAYLRPSVGAAAMGLGSAFSAMPEYLAPWWNPAVIAIRKGNMASGGVGSRSMGRTDGYASMEFHIPPRAAMGLMVLYRGDPFLNNLYDENEKPLDKGAFTSFTGKIALSYLVNRKLSAGLNIGLSYEKLPTSSNSDGSLAYSSSSGIGSFDLAVAYKYSEKLSLSLVAANLGSSMKWDINSDWSPVIEDKPVPSFTFGSRYEGSLAKRPLIWTMDLKAYIIDGDWNKIPNPQMVVYSGWEWQRWDSFYIRGGLGDLDINGTILRDAAEYFSDFPVRITAGFGLDLSRYKNGLRLNYGVSTDKLWAGIDQQLDVTLSF